jgi:diguanylate cyclase (GGDEF)-like protein
VNFEATGRSASLLAWALHWLAEHIVAAPDSTLSFPNSEFASTTLSWQHSNSRAFSVLAAVALTVLVVLAHAWIPEERLVIAGNGRFPVTVQSNPVPGLQTPGVWLNEAERSFRCKYPDGINDPGYYCSINFYFFSTPTQGLDLSRFERVELALSYVGSSAKVRLFARNYDPRYSKPEDDNSTKYNAILLSSEDLGQPVSISLKEFTVSEWWRDMYKVPRPLAQPELTNVVSMGIDYAYPMVAGDHDVQVKRLEFVRPRIPREIWYLSILCFWLGAAALYAVSQLRSQSMRGSALKREAQKYRMLATTDPLTQILNRHGLEQRWAAMNRAAANPVVASSAPGAAQALLVVDIDHFKRINDTRGHDAGDRVLRRMASLIQRSLRATDPLARWGGEEFVVLLPSVLPEHVLRLAESIRSAVETIVFEPEDALHVTVSLGAAVRLPDESFDSLFKRADAALYQAKSGGRNRVVLAAQPPLG